MENFDSLVVKLLAAVAVIIVLAATSCSINKSYIARDLVKGGIDPIAVQCLISGDSRDATCIILATKK